MDKTRKLHIEESELLVLLENKDRNGFNILYQNYSGAIYGIIIRMLREEEEATDMLQEVFIKIWNKIDSYDRKKGRLFTWMANLTRNLVIDRIRSADYKNHTLKNFVRDDNVRVTDSQYSSITKTDSIGLTGLVGELKPELRVLIQKIYFEGYTQSDLAEELEIPLGTLKTRVRAAIKALRKQFD
ncbi:RNA polymerase sigma factor [Arcticibacterium luteifluviistationis]|uniref:RNA polymerase subunit sigma-70 n=1 Tax=Arcticibacterium luteifluviistationis TaxID=1784714 RepID=A0A2Z4GIJ8_9BACT|nr:sigma-70 family RNA polymerase sigma factor [Arcticibacterium luteifluviistationis]AWW00879.1 RNA polymerase subunit sigma-70 [Arcticibacterium luteifluviistationis]